MDEDERKQALTDGAAAYVRAGVYDRLKDVLPAAMIARAVDGAEDGTLIRLFESGMREALDSGGATDMKTATGRALLHVLREQATEVRNVLDQQATKNRELAIYQKGRLDGAGRAEGAKVEGGTGEHAKADPPTGG